MKQTNATPLEADEYASIFDKFRKSMGAQEAFEATEAEWFRLEGESMYRNIKHFQVQRSKIRKARAEGRLIGGVRVTERSKEIVSFLTIMDGNMDKNQYEQIETLWTATRGKRCFSSWVVFYSTDRHYRKSGRFEAINKVA